MKMRIKLLFGCVLVFAAVHANAGDGMPGSLPVVTNAPGGRVIAYYFHGTVRCESCLEIEKQAREIIERRFATELAANRLVFSSLNYDLKENAHLLQDYKLPCPSLVLVPQTDGKEGKWKMLGETWTLIKDPTAFGEYVVKEVRACLNDRNGGVAETSSDEKKPIPDSTPGTAIDSLADLNTRFGDLNAAFVFVHATNATSSVDWEPINRARRDMESDWQIKIGSFEWKPSSGDYRQLAERLPRFQLPTVMVTLRNGTMTMLSGHVTETNLIQGFRYAVSAAGCCPFGEH